MLTTEPTREMLEEWREIFKKYAPILKANRKTGYELNDYFKGKYSYSVCDDSDFKNAVIGNITENAHFRDKLPVGVEPDVRCYKTGEVLVGIDCVSGEFFVECEDIQKTANIYDDLFVYRGLDEKDLENYFLVAQYVILTRRNI